MAQAAPAPGAGGREQAPGAPGAAAARPRLPRASGVERGLAAALAAGLAAVLAVGRLLEPSPTGTGTHTVLGLPPCGMMVVSGRPCPTCGVTTSLVLAAHGRLGDALVNQPFGVVVFLTVVALLAGAVVVAVTGRSLRPLVTPRRAVAAGVGYVVLALASWAYRWSRP